MIFQDPYFMVGVCWRGGGGRRACVHGLPRNAAEFRGMLVCCTCWLRVRVLGDSTLKNHLKETTH